MRSNDQTLGDAIREWLRENGMEQKLNEVRLVKLWDKEVGPMISRHTEKVFVKQRKLFVKLDSPALKNELSFSKEKLVNILNDSVGSQVIDDVVFL